MAVRPLLALVASTLALGACRLEQRAAARSDTTTVVDVTTLPDPAPHKRVGFRIPSESEIVDPVVLASVRRGRAILRNAGDSLPRHVGNALTCTSCHQQDGTVKHGMSWVGVYARFPQYRARAGGTQIIEDRVNDCIKRSLNGRPLVPESRDMRDIVAYMAFLSTGYPVGAEVDGQGLRPVTPVETDARRGREVYTARCSRCHGTRGEGLAVAPPVWGPQSFNIGAGMARVRTAAAFIRARMPQDSAGVLTDQEAYDVARFITSQSRPDFKGKERDWPRGDPPPDVAYPTLAKKGKG